MKRIIWISLVLLSLGSYGDDLLKPSEKDYSSIDKTEENKPNKESTASIKEAIEKFYKPETEETDIEEPEESLIVSTTAFVDADDDEIGYYSEGTVIGAFVPNYEHYDQAAAITILGQPTQIVTDQVDIIARLDLEGSEFERIKGEFQAGRLTESQAKAFAFQMTDIETVTKMGSKIVGLIYDDPQKPNVYLLDGKVAYVTPIIAYLEFNGKLVQ